MGGGELPKSWVAWGKYNENVQLKNICELQTFGKIVEANKNKGEEEGSMENSRFYFVIFSGLDFFSFLVLNFSIL